MRLPRRRSGRKPPVVVVVGSLAVTIALWVAIDILARRPVWLW